MVVGTREVTSDPAVDPKPPPVECTAANTDANASAPTIAPTRITYNTRDGFERRDAPRGAPLIGAGAPASPARHSDTDWRARGRARVGVRHKQCCSCSSYSSSFQAEVQVIFSHRSPLSPAWKSTSGCPQMDQRPRKRCNPRQHVRFSRLSIASPPMTGPETRILLKICLPGDPRSVVASSGKPGWKVFLWPVRSATVRTRPGACQSALARASGGRFQGQHTPAFSRVHALGFVSCGQITERKSRLETDPVAHGTPPIWTDKMAKVRPFVTLWKWRLPPQFPPHLSRQHANQPPICSHASKPRRVGHAERVHGARITRFSVRENLSEMAGMVNPAVRGRIPTRPGATTRCT